jgi:hypothetical protein
MAGPNIDIFNTGYRPVPSAIPVWPDGRQATWPATTSTLISGERDGVVIDVLVTKSESQELADWLATTGKNLTEVYITHAHGDRFFGLNTVLDKFPQARAVALPEIVPLLAEQATPDGCRSGTASSLTSCSRSRRCLSRSTSGSSTLKAIRSTCSSSDRAMWPIRPPSTSLTSTHFFPATPRSARPRPVP